ncbi:MAG: ferredoxin--NADP reductase [Thermoplasmata archaeon]
MMGKMGMKPYEIYEIRDLTHGEQDSFKIASFKLRPDDGQNFTFKPGQFVSLFMNPEDKLFRSYSIASSPLDGHLELMIELINGRFTSQLAKMNEGSRIYVTEPRGAFVFDEESANGSIFLAAGIGIAPFFSMLRYLRQKGMERDIYLFYSVKHKDDIVNREELEGFAQNGLKIVFTVTRDPENPTWKGEHGRINIDMIKRHVPDFKGRTVYLCGGIKFVKDLVAEFMAEGFKDQDIKRDIWGE